MSINSYDNRSSTTRNPSIAALESGPLELSKFEAHCYYAGLRSNGRGPKLIYRDSSDVYERPYGPEQYKRLMRLVAVPDNHEFGKHGLWDMVRDKVVELLDAKNIEPTCVDFVRFSWQDGESTHVTNPTIWVGLAPGTLTASAAFNATKDIRAFLDGLNFSATNIDIAYRETIPVSLSGPGPPLFPPSEFGTPLMEIIDNVSVALSLPVAGLDTGMQGTLGPYFHAGNRLFAITTRHNLFSYEEGNEEYKYNESDSKKAVVLMGEPAFTNYLDSIQTHIATLLHTAKYLQKKVDKLTGAVGDQTNPSESQIRLNDNIAELTKFRSKANKFEDFYMKIKKEWSGIEQRVIGHIVWAPPLGVGAAPHRYTHDICVVELYKDKFTHLIGNILSLGPEHSQFELRKLLDNACNNVASQFEYPEDGLLPLRGILSADQILNPSTNDLEGKSVRRVLKRGFATNTTVGTVSRYRSFVRRHLPSGRFDSLELPIIPHEREAGTFAKGGDSGSIVVSPRGEFVSLLTSGTNQGVQGSDIAYSTMFEWVWKLVLAEFPDASLYWDDIPAFLAAVAV